MITHSIIRPIRRLRAWISAKIDAAALDIYGVTILRPVGARTVSHTRTVGR